jgi:hypothetical protein
MYNRRLAVWASLLLVAMLVLSGCAPRPGAGTSAALASEPGELVIDLPAIVVDINADGSPSVGNVPVAQLGAMANVDLSTLAVDPAWVNYMTASGIQHLQVTNGAGGLLVLVNGEPVPSVEWNGESLVATAEAMKTFGVAIPLLEKVLPLAQRLGIGVIVRFPVPAGAAVIPLFIEGESAAAKAARQAQEEFLAAVGSPPKINIPVFYEADGSFSVGDLTDADWSALTGAPLYTLRLSPQLIQSLSNAGVKSLGVRTDAKGVHVTMNDMELPTLTWDGGKLQHLLDVADQMNLWALVAPTMQVGDVLTAVNSVLPVVQTTNANIMIILPGGSMAVSR